MNRWTVESTDKLLSFVKKKFNTSYSSKDLRWSIEHNRCAVNGFVERFCSHPLKRGDEVVFLPVKKESHAFEQERVLYEDSHFLAYNKPPFLDTETLAEKLNLFPAHRLDRDTTGVILFAKHQKALKYLEDLFRNRNIEKEYFALVHGTVSASQGIIEENLHKVHPRKGVALSHTVSKGEGLRSKTQWKCLKKKKNASLLLCQPLTGRTHQIRAHLKSIGHPLWGDYEYGKKVFEENLFRPLLHAKSLTFVHFETKEIMILSAPLPDDFVYWENKLL